MKFNLFTTSYLTPPPCLVHSPGLYKRDDLGVGLASDTLSVDGDNPVPLPEARVVGGAALLHLLHKDGVHGLQGTQLGPLALAS